MTDVTREGKWTCSTCEEIWNGSDEFDTKEEALEYAITEFAPDYGVEDGGNLWIGQIHEIKEEELARQGASAWKVIDNLAEALFEMVGDEVNYELKVPKVAEEDLDERLTVVIRDWMIAHGIKPNCWQINNVTRHTWEQCKETRQVDAAPSSEETPHVEQCVLNIEHEGACEWP